MVQKYMDVKLSLSHSSLSVELEFRTRYSNVMLLSLKTKQIERRKLFYYYVDLFVIKYILNIFRNKT